MKKSKEKKTKIPVFFSHRTGARTRLKPELHPTLSSLIPQMVKCFSENKRLMVLPEDIYVSICIECGWKDYLRAGKIPEKISVILDAIPYKIDIKRDKLSPPQPIQAVD